MKTPIKTPEIIIYKTKSGAVQFRADIGKETLWATQAEIAQVFGVNPQAITKHLKNIYAEGELYKKATCSKMEQVRAEGGRTVRREVDCYNLDAIISVGYRINSKTGTKFRQWATGVLRAHVVEGFTVNKARIEKNYQAFLDAVHTIKKIMPAIGAVDGAGVLALIEMFADTWFSLDAFDKRTLPKSGAQKKKIDITAGELNEALIALRNTVVVKNKEGSDLFGQERTRGTVEGILKSVFQTFDGQDVYATLEEKAAHLFYFFVKNHPFVDGNKRCGAFAFVWFLKKVGMLDVGRFSPEALTALTLLVAQSKPADKEDMVGLILMFLNRQVLCPE